MGLFLGHQAVGHIAFDLSGAVFALLRLWNYEPSEQWHGTKLTVQLSLMEMPFLVIDQSIEHNEILT